MSPVATAGFVFSRPCIFYVHSLTWMLSLSWGFSFCPPASGLCVYFLYILVGLRLLCFLTGLVRAIDNTLNSACSACYYYAINRASEYKRFVFRRLIFLLILAGSDRSRCYCCTAAGWCSCAYYFFALPPGVNCGESICTVCKESTGRIWYYDTRYDKSTRTAV